MKLTDEEEKIVSVQGHCPICDAKDGQRCIGKNGKVLDVGKLHAGRLRDPLRVPKAPTAAN